VLARPRYGRALTGSFGKTEITVPRRGVKVVIFASIKAKVSLILSAIEQTPKHITSPVRLLRISARWLGVV
jgi:hypothetical protein